MKTERMIEIENQLGWSEDQIHDALAVLHDSAYAETKLADKIISICFDSSIQKLCFEYIEGE